MVIDLCCEELRGEIFIGFTGSIGFSGLIEFAGIIQKTKTVMHQINFSITE